MRTPEEENKHLRSIIVLVDVELLNVLRWACLTGDGAAVSVAIRRARRLLETAFEE